MVDFRQSNAFQSYFLPLGSIAIAPPSPSTLSVISSKHFRITPLSPERVIPNQVKVQVTTLMLGIYYLAFLRYRVQIDFDNQNYNTFFITRVTRSGTILWLLLCRERLVAILKATRLRYKDSPWPVVETAA